MAFEEKTLDDKLVYHGLVFDVHRYTVTAVNGGTAERDIVDHNGGSVMLAITDQGKVLTVRQYRKSMEREMLELPAGKLDKGEDPLEAAARELREETGYTASDIRHLITVNVSCGYDRELLHIYLCRGLTPGETDFDETEDLDLYEYDPDELFQMVMRGEIYDAKTVIGILFARCAGEI
ncbi:MAG: NUDIX hydrolase [Mogibacterium sp.]|nr:NUDIX hydrolase [Mogibacterium sp.]